MIPKKNKIYNFKMKKITNSANNNCLKVFQIIMDMNQATIKRNKNQTIHITESQQNI